MTIHEEASQAYREALADGCACWRCQDAGLRAVVQRLGLLMARALDADGTTVKAAGDAAHLLREMGREA